MADLLRDLLAFIGVLALAWTAGGCIRDMLKHVPDHLPPPRDDSRDKRREWDRIQGR